MRNNDVATNEKSSVMLTPEEIKQHIDAVVKIKNKHDSDCRSASYNGLEYPEYYPGHNILCAHYDSIRVHSETGVFPHKLFSKRSPNMQPEEFDYIKAAYQQTTLPVFIDYINQLKRSFNDGNWSIDYDKKDPNTEDFQEYVEKDFPVYGSFETFEKQVLPEIKTKDPMGMVAYRPVEIPIQKDADGNPILNEKNNFIPDDSVLVSPGVNYFTIKQLVAFKEHEWYIYLSKNKSIVDYMDRPCKEGLIFEVYDDTNIYFVKQVGKKIDYAFEIYTYYAHNLGYVPATRLKGVPVVMEDEIYYQSKFLYAIGNLNLALVNSTRLDMINNNSAFPVRIMVGNECDFQEGDYKCNDGNIAYYDGAIQKIKKCPACNGAGLKVRISPLGIILVKPNNRENPNGEISPEAIFRYVSPDQSTSEFLLKKIQDDETRARAILHIYNTNTKAQPTSSDTAIGQQIDEKSLYAFIKPESDQMFDFWEWSYKVIGDMRYNKQFTAPTFTRPVTFEFLTEQDYIAQIKSAMDAGMPPSVIYPLIYRFISTLFYTEADTNKAFTLITEADRLLTQTDVQISAGLLNNTIEKWEKILHDSSFFFVKQLQEDNKDFFSKEPKEQKQLLIDLAKLKASEISPQAASNTAIASLTNETEI